MRTAILVGSLAGERAPSESSTESDSLRPILEAWGFQALRIAGGDPKEELGRALGEVNAADTVLVHVSGTLESAPILRVRLGADLGSLSMAELGQLLLASRAEPFLFAELTPQDEGAALALDADGARLREALAPSLESGVPEAARISALVAVHAASHGAPPLEFTRLVARAVTELIRDGGTRVRASEAVERVRVKPETHAIVTGFTFIQGERDFELALPSDASLDAPDLRLLLELADHALSSGDWPHAAAAYRAVLPLCAYESERAAVYGRIAAAEEGQGRTEQARRAYHKAIAANPTDPGMRDALIRMETARQEWARVVQAMRDRLEYASSPAERVEELFSIARITLEMQRDMKGAVSYLEAARAIDGRDEDVLEALRRSYRVLGQWASLIEVTGVLAAQAPTPAERASRHFAQAETARKHLEDTEQAAKFVLDALGADPTHDEAFELLCQVRASRSEEDLLSTEVALLVERLSAAGDEDRAAKMRSRMASLASTSEGRSSDATSETVPGRVEVLDENERVLAALQEAVARDPLAPENHAALFALHTRAGRTQQAYFSALALEELGVVDDERARVLAQCRPTVVSARAPLGVEAWQLLRAPSGDEALEALLGSVGRAATMAIVDDRKGKKRLLVLDDDRRQPETSTASIVRTFHWAAGVLGVTCPDLYVLDDVPGDVVAVPGDKGRTAVGPRVLSGLSTIDLAFLCARHLTYYRKEYAALIACPTLDELRVLTLAALQTSLPAMPIPPSLESEVAVLRAGLKRHVSAEEREALNVAAARLEARGGEYELQDWMAGVELTAARVGLLLSGDLRAAMSRIRGESRTVGDLSVEAKRSDLLSFSTTTTFSLLREQLTGATVRSPKSDSGLVTRTEGGATLPAPSEAEQAAG
jgi:tetratricopeptide (TPR) repeat protein